MPSRHHPARVAAYRTTVLILLACLVYLPLHPRQEHVFNSLHEDDHSSSSSTTTLAGAEQRPVQDELHGIERPSIFDELADTLDDHEPRGTALRTTHKDVNPTIAVPVVPVTRKAMTASSCFSCHLTTVEVMFHSDAKRLEDIRTVSVDNIFATHQRDQNETDLRRQVQNEQFVCVLRDSDNNPANGDQPVSYPITPPAAFVEEHMHAIESGMAHVCIPGGTVDPWTRQLTWPEGSQFRLRPVSGSRKRRLLTAKTGIKRILVVRVHGNNGLENPEDTAHHLQAAVFGTYSDANIPAPLATVTSQYQAMSQGKLIWVPATGPGIDGGVLGINITRSFVNADIQGDVMTEFISKVYTILQIQSSLTEVTDHIIFSLPSGSLLGGQGTWSAFAYLNEPYSFFHRARAISLSIAVHEIGHSLGFRHSGYQSDSYGDTTGYMGYSYWDWGTPRIAFNGHKHWLSGWFQSSAMKVIDPLQLGSVSGRLVAFVDYNETYPSNRFYDAVLLQLGNWYFQYNAAKKYTPDATTAGLVSITQARSEAYDSIKVTNLAPGQSLRRRNFSGSGNSLVIRFCFARTNRKVQFAFLSFYLSNDSQGAKCNTNTRFA